MGNLAGSVRSKAPRTKQPHPAYTEEIPREQHKASLLRTRPHETPHPASGQPTSSSSSPFYPFPLGDSTLCFFALIFLEAADPTRIPSVLRYLPSSSSVICSNSWRLPFSKYSRVLGDVSRTSVAARLSAATASSFFLSAAVLPHCLGHCDRPWLTGCEAVLGPATAHVGDIGNSCPCCGWRCGHDCGCGISGCAGVSASYSCTNVGSGEDGDCGRGGN